jgi:hypothetical protein
VGVEGEIARLRRAGFNALSALPIPGHSGEHLFTTVDCGMSICTRWISSGIAGFFCFPVRWFVNPLREPLLRSQQNSHK